MLRIFNILGSPLHLKLHLPDIIQQLWEHLCKEYDPTKHCLTTSNFSRSLGGNIHCPITLAFYMPAKSTPRGHCLVVLLQAPDGVCLLFATAAMAFGGLGGRSVQGSTSRKALYSGALHRSFPSKEKFFK